MKPVVARAPASYETRATARHTSIRRFREAGIDSADLDARLLVCAAAGIHHAALIRDPDVPLDEVATRRLESYVERRLKREPVSRIIGIKEFWGLSFRVSPAALDPRPETEGLVASVLDALGGRREAPLAILDLGTGSGVILVALLHELRQASGIGVDRSIDACRLARANAAANGCPGRAAFVCGDWGAALSTRFDVVVSNPPYIAAAAIGDLYPEVCVYDPLVALDGGPDGLDAYRALVPSLSRLLVPNGIAALECGAGQGESVRTMMAEAGLHAAVYLDLAGHDRVVLGTS